MYDRGPKDVEGECNARLYIGDDNGDGTATMRCQLAPEHEPPHQETFERRGKPVIVTWYGCCREEEKQFEAEYHADMEAQGLRYCESCLDWFEDEACPICPGEDYSISFEIKDTDLTKTEEVI